MAVTWTNKKPIHKTTYNIGNKIVDNTNPVWDMNGQTGVPFGNKHDPCGYWYGKEPSPVPSQPNVVYTLWSCGRNLNNALGRIGDNNIFLPMDDTSYFRKISIGNTLGLYIKTDGTLWGIGSNNNGELGTGDILIRTTMTRIGTDSDWLDVSTTGYSHSLALKENGSLWATGYNHYGQLGLGDTIDRLTFTQVGAEYDWKVIYGNSYSSYAIKNDGQLYSWGGGLNGNLGHGNTLDYHVPTKVVTNGGGFDSLTGGQYAAIGLKGGKIWSCGWNLYGQLCLDNTTATNVFTERTAGETWNYVSLGAIHTLLVKNDGTLWAVGHNSSGNLGLGDQTNRTVVTQVGTDTDWWKANANGSGSYKYSFALKQNGVLYSCGSNYWGQLGLGSGLAQGPFVFTQVGSETWGTIVCGESHSNAGKVVYVWE